MIATEDHFLGGVGPRLVLLHSGFQTWKEWRSVLPRLTREREVLAPTLPGSFGGVALEADGRSFLEALADHVEVRLDEAGWDGPVAVAGSSHGAVVALELASRGRAASVVALAPPWVASAFNATAWAAVFLPVQATLRLTQRFHGRLATWGPYGGLYFAGSPGRAAIDPKDLMASMRSFGRFPLLQITQNEWFAGRRMPDLQSVTCPVVLVQGTSDRIVPLWMHRRWAAALPAAQTVLLDDFPHCPHLRDPDRIADLVLGAPTGATSDTAVSDTS